MKKKAKTFNQGQEHKWHAGELQKDFILPPFKGTTEASKETDKIQGLRTIWKPVWKICTSHVIFLKDLPISILFMSMGGS